IIVWTRYHAIVLFHVLLLATGWLTWTFIEYVIHRFWMHHKTADHGRSISQGHQHHHHHPSELQVNTRQRIYMLMILIGSCLVAIWLHNYFTFITGICIGMLGYMHLHKFLHTRAADRFFKRLLRYHIYHHCKYPDTCFGVSTTLWDNMFGTVPPKETTISPRVLAFYLDESKRA